MTRKRSPKQNRYLWLVYGQIAAATQRTPQDVHDLLAAWFLPRPRLRRLSNWPDGDIRTIVRDVRSTAQLTPAEFQDYVDKVREFARTLLGLDIDPPDYLRFGPPDKDWRKRA